VLRTADWNRHIPGLAGQIAYYIYQNAYKQNPEVAIVADSVHVVEGTPA
jgi:hypothetical protein